MAEDREGPELFSDAYARAVDREMRAILSAHDPSRGDLFGMLRYHLGWVDPAFQPCEARSGKRVRPVLCLLACEGCGGSWDQAVPAAAGIELLHNFSLIHDDIEDRDERRRGRLTVWATWGEAHGINAGDTMFSLAQLAVLRLVSRGVPAATVVEAATLFNETCVALTAGQHLDIRFEGRAQISVEEYLAMVAAKTAALIACACEIGAVVGGAPADQRRQLRAFGRHVGLAFQMQDDILGIWGDPKTTGKPVGSDILRRKKTLPVIHGLEQSAELRALLAGANLTGADVRRATELLEEVGSRTFTEDLAGQQFDRAMAALARAKPAPPAGPALRDLAERLLQRTS